MQQEPSKCETGKATQDINTIPGHNKKAKTNFEIFSRRIFSHRI
jgi:hypothetical protein